MQKCAWCPSVLWSVRLTANISFTVTWGSRNEAALQPDCDSALFRENWFQVKRQKSLVEEKSQDLLVNPTTFPGNGIAAPFCKRTSLSWERVICSQLLVAAVRRPSFIHLWPCSQHLNPLIGRRFPNTFKYILDWSCHVLLQGDANKLQTSVKRHPRLRSWTFPEAANSRALKMSRFI